jgi:hypothetical protein
LMGMMMEEYSHVASSVFEKWSVRNKHFIILKLQTHKTLGKHYALLVYLKKN